MATIILLLLHTGLCSQRQNCTFDTSPLSLCEAVECFMVWKVDNVMLLTLILLVGINRKGVSITLLCTSLSAYIILEGTVQRKLRWVKSSTNR
jgi:hypothetical protein